MRLSSWIALRSPLLSESTEFPVNWEWGPLPRAAIPEWRTPASPASYLRCLIPWTPGTVSTVVESCPEFKSCFYHFLYMKSWAHLGHQWSLKVATHSAGTSPVAGAGVSIFSTLESGQALKLPDQCIKGVLSQLGAQP